MQNSLDNADHRSDAVRRADASDNTETNDAATAEVVQLLTGDKVEAADTSAEPKFEYTESRQVGPFAMAHRSNKDGGNWDLFRDGERVNSNFQTYAGVTHERRAGVVVATGLDGTKSHANFADVYDARTGELLGRFARVKTRESATGKTIMQGQEDDGSWRDIALAGEDAEPKVEYTESRRMRTFVAAHRSSKDGGNWDLFRDGKQLNTGLRTYGGVREDGSAGIVIASGLDPMRGNASFVDLFDTSTGEHLGTFQRFEVKDGRNNTIVVRGQKQNGEWTEVKRR